MSAAPASGRAADTIFALASGAGRAAISVIRLSGPEAGPILRSLCSRLPPARQASLRRLTDAHGATLDQALVLWMPAPRSATGEDTAELHVHGGRAVLAAITTALLAAGARPRRSGGILPSRLPRRQTRPAGSRGDCRPRGSRNGIATSSSAAPRQRCAIAPGVRLGRPAEAWSRLPGSTDRLPR